MAVLFLVGVGDFGQAVGVFQYAIDCLDFVGSVFVFGQVQTVAVGIVAEVLAFLYLVASGFCITC